MGVLQRSVNHSVIGRAIADRTVQPVPLEAREPQLIKLPIPLPSIPVLSPLLSPVVGGNNGNGNGGGSSKAATTTKSTTTTSQAAPPAQTSSSPSGGSSGSGSGSSSSSGSGSSSSSSGDSGSSSSSSDSPPPSSGDSSSSSSSGTTPGNSGDGTGNSGTSPSDSTPSSSSGSASTTTTSSSSSSGNNGNANDSSSDVGGGSVLSSASGNGTDGSGSSSTGGASPAGVANAGSIPKSGSGSSGSSGTSGSSGSSGSSNSPSTGTSVVAGASSPSTSQGTSDGTGPATVGGSSQQGASKHGLSGGAIAGIVMVLILLIVVALVFCVRRRTRARRDHRANVWWFSSKRTSQTYGDGDETQVANINGTRSARSSFATTVDHSITHQRSSEFVIPPLPPMAEVGRGNGAAPSLVLETSYFASTDANVNASDPRFSIGSGHSNASETSLNAQYLVVHRGDSLNNQNTNNNEPFTPMSVRPFSPSESFAFPRPPDPVGDRTSAYSRVSSGVSMGMGASRSQSSPTEAPALPLPLLTVSPISPTLVHPATATATTADVITPVNPFADDNPFDDPAGATAASGLPTPSAPASNPPTGEFADIEYIRRPFYPTLPDELAVKPDDNVRVLQAFDDGWALVEKVDGSGKGKGREDEVRQGLIPIDCLREPGLDLTTFIEAKRVSGYDESVGYQSVVAI